METKRRRTTSVKLEPGSILSGEARREVDEASRWFDEQMKVWKQLVNHVMDIFVMLQVTSSGQRLELPIFIPTSISKETECGFFSATMERFAQKYKKEMPEDETLEVHGLKKLKVELKNAAKGASWEYALPFEWLPKAEIKQEALLPESDMKSEKIEVDLVVEDSEDETADSEPQPPSAVKEEIDQEAYDQEMNEEDAWFLQQQGAETPLLDADGTNHADGDLQDAASEARGAGSRVPMTPPNGPPVVGHLKVKNIGRHMGEKELRESLEQFWFRVSSVSIPKKQDKPDAKYGFVTGLFTDVKQRATYYAGRFLDAHDANGASVTVLVFEAKPRQQRQAPSRGSTTAELEIFADLGKLESRLPQEEVRKRLQEMVSLFGEYLRGSNIKQNNKGSSYAHFDVKLYMNKCKEFFQRRHAVVDNGITVLFAMSTSQKKKHKESIKEFLETQSVDRVACDKFLSQSEAVQLAVMADATLQKADNPSAMLMHLIQKKS